MIRLKKKISLFELYKKELTTTAGVITFLIVGVCMFIFPVTICIAVGFIMLIVLVHMFQWLISRYRQTKLPLTKEELDKLNIKTIEEYAEFLDNFLFQYAPKIEMLYLITIYTIVNFKEEYIRSHILIYAPNIISEETVNSPIFLERHINDYFSYNGSLIYPDEINRLNYRYNDATKIKVKISRNRALELCLQVFRDTKYEEVVRKLQQRNF